MRYKTYYKLLEFDPKPTVLPFSPEHYKEAGMPYSPEAGMPVLEAHQLVNKWNRKTSAFKFWLED
jgi:hypothetical protein